MTDTALEPLAAALIEAATRAGADAADALVVNGTSVSIGVLNSTLEQAERAEGIDLGLRVLVGKRQACVSASDTSPDTMREMAERAVAMARLAPEDPYAGLAEPSQLGTIRDGAALDMHDAGADPDPATLEAMALEAEAAALKVDGVSQVSNAGAGFSRRQIYLAATNGFGGGYARTDQGTHCIAITGEGPTMERDYFGDSRNHAADLMSPTEVGRIAAERTVARAGAKKPPTGTFPVMYDERVAAGLIGHLLAASNGTAIARGASWARDLLGEQVLPKGMSLIEEPHRPRTSASRPFDAEGLPTADRMLVEDGMLTGWTLDLATARKLGMTSTASASRGLSAPPSPSVGNVRLVADATPRGDLLRDMGTGLLITSLIGSSINATTGDYSRGASGFWVENGEITYAVNECTVAGNLADMLRGVIPADDARAHLSRVVPSLLVEGLTIAGA